MRVQNRPLLVLLACVAVVLVVVLGTVFYLSRSPGGATLSIPAGTVITRLPYSVSFTVTGGVGRLVGAWDANGVSVVAVAWSNYTWSWGPHFPCVASGPWNGTANVSLVPGTYTMTFGAGTFGWKPGGTLTVAQPIRVVYPGVAPGTNQTLLANWCASPTGVTVATFTGNTTGLTPDFTITGTDAWVNATVVGDAYPINQFGYSTYEAGTNAYVGGDEFGAFANGPFQQGAAGPGPGTYFFDVYNMTGIVSWQLTVTQLS
jgi:hypothetical protein